MQPLQRAYLFTCRLKVTVPPSQECIERGIQADTHAATFSGPKNRGRAPFTSAWPARARARTQPSQPTRRSQSASERGETRVPGRFFALKTSRLSRPGLGEPGVTSSPYIYMYIYIHVRAFVCIFFPFFLSLTLFLPTPPLSPSPLSDLLLRAPFFLFSRLGRAAHTCARTGLEPTQRAGGKSSSLFRDDSPFPFFFFSFSLSFFSPFSFSFSFSFSSSVNGRQQPPLSSWLVNERELSTSWIDGRSV